MKNVLKRLTALLLSVLMVTGLFADCLPAALAAGGSVSLPKAATTEVNPADPAAGRPRLYVDFLGDNGKYNPAGTATPSGTPAKPSATNAQGTDSGKWNKYTNSDDYSGKTIFWVGIGIDRMNVLDLFKDWQNGMADGNKGITTLETAFYYNSKFIEPYTGALPADTEAQVNEKFKGVLAGANIGSGSLTTNNTSWSGDYEILSASTGCAPQQEVVTQEVIADPGMADIMAAGTPGAPNPWRMSYLSLAQTKNMTTGHRFQNDWTGIFDAVTETNNKPTQYLAVVPFVLKAYDADAKLPLRLARNAELFTLGGGDTGAVRYGAWENVTTRTPRHNIKLMTDFTGDLNIFTGAKVKGPDYNAKLVLENKVSSELTTVLGITNDAAPFPKTITDNGQSLTPLAGGTGLELKLHCPTGFTAVVTVTADDVAIPSIAVTETAGATTGDKIFRFVMPQSHVTVKVVFTVTDATNFMVTLADGLLLADLDKGNKVRIDTQIAVLGADGKPTAANVPGFVHSFSVGADGALMSPKRTQARKETAVAVTVNNHPNYTATVAFTDALKNQITPTTATGPEGEVIAVEAVGTVMPHGGVITLNSMPVSDIFVTVTYAAVNLQTAQLEVWHEDETSTSVNHRNAAQLAAVGYDAVAAAAPIYSDVVYQNVSGTAYPAGSADGDHHAAATFRILERTNAADGTESGSLGGDGNLKLDTTWHIGADAVPTAFLTKACAIYEDTAFATLEDKAAELNKYLLSRDLAALKLYKNSYKEPFGDSDKIDFARTLLELVARCTLATDATEKGYLKTVPATAVAPIVPAYTYLNLTQNQVQAYLNDRLLAKAAYEKNSKSYTALVSLYDRAVVAYQQTLASNKVTAKPEKLAPPAPPAAESLDAKFVRSFTPETYGSTGYADGYGAYSAKWLTYYNELLAEKVATKPGDVLPNLPAKAGTIIAPAGPVPALPATPTPKAETPQATLSARSGRDVTLTLESNSAYTVTKIELLKQSDRTLLKALDLTAERKAGYQNVFHFAMPEQGCIVKVTYGLRVTDTLKLAIVGGGGKNAVSVTGHGAADATGITDDVRTSKPFEKMTLNGHQRNAVLAGSTVTAAITCRAGYSWTAVITPTIGGIVKPAISAATGSLTGTADGGFTFKMPTEKDASVEIRVTYVSAVKGKFDAYLVDENAPAGGKSLWTNGLTKMTGVEEGTLLTGNITVPAGAYIRSVSVLSGQSSSDDIHSVVTTGSIPYTLTGNGYQNGAGGTETVSITMPRSHVYVLVDFSKGVPPSEPDQRLTLQVVDGENSGPNYASNTVVAATNTAPTPLTLTAGKRTENTVAPDPAELYDFGYAHAGDAVTLTLKPDTGYYTSLLVIGPQGTGVTPVWTSETTARFVMPAGDASVTVTFVKKPTDGGYPGENWLYLSKKEAHTSGDTSLPAQNEIPFVYSDTLKQGAMKANAGFYTTGKIPTGTYLEVPEGSKYNIARNGETVTLHLNVTPGWYLHSLTVLDNGAALPYTIADNGGNSGTDANGYNGGRGAQAKPVMEGSPAVIKSITGGVKATFQMPAGHVHVTAHYHQGDPANDRVHSLGLRVLDPENGNPATVQNTAKLTATDSIPGSTPAIVGPLGKDGFASEHVRFGDRVSIDWTAANGYGLDIVEVTPAGEVPVPTVTKTETVAGVTTGTAAFTMPDRDAVVEVRFKAGAAKAYTANLVLRMPEGSPVDLTMADVGAGTFAAPTAGTLQSPVYSVSGPAGTKVDLKLFAENGYYIRAVTVTPADHNATETVHLSGTFGTQTASFALPAASPSTVNVFFGKGYPGEVHYPLTLKVTDRDRTASGLNNEAHFGEPFTAPGDIAPVLGGQQKTVTPGLLDGATANVTVKPLAGYTADITAQNAAGQSVPCSATGTGVSFRISDSPVTVSVVFRKELPADKHNIKLITTLVDSATAAGAPGAVIALKGDKADMTIDGTGCGTLANVPKGAPVVFTVTPNAGTLVTKAYAVDTKGRQLILPPSQVTAGGTVTFGMPNTDATVYLELDDTPHAADQFPATLTLMGPGNATTTATMAAAGGTPTITVTTGFADSSKTLFATQESLMTVTVGQGADPYPPFFAGIQITDKNGADIPYQTAQGKLEFTYKLPHGGAKVTVFLFGFPDDGGGSILGDQHMTQIISNQDSFPGVGLDATISTVEIPARSYSIMAKNGDVLNIHLTLQTGYRVENITVFPASYGLVPTLGKPSTVSQDTSIVLPDDSVIVSVSFARDEIARKKATLSLTWEGNTVAIPANEEATLHSAVTGTKKIATIPGTESVQGGVGELVTATYPLEIQLTPNSFCSAGTVTVKRADGSPVPFTQVSPIKVAFPMVDSDATVTVNYMPLSSPDSGLNELPAVLHVVDLSAGSTIKTAAQAYGQLVYGANNTGKIVPLPEPGGTATIQVPAGDTVTLKTFTDANTYVQAAYAIYQEGGQMIKCDLGAFNGTKSTTFAMHSGQVDVYVYVNTAPNTHHSAVLKVVDSDKADTTSTGFMKADTVAETVTATVNGGEVHLPVPAGKKVTIELNIQTGYTPELVLVTPLGITLAEYTQVANTITFTMPTGQNVMVLVKLHKKTLAEYQITYHVSYRDSTGAPIATPPAKTTGKVYVEGTTTPMAVKDMDKITVPESKTVCLDVLLTDTPGVKWTVLAAYAILDAAVVPMAPQLEGSIDTVTDPLKADQTAKFTMPAGNTDVYLVFTQEALAGTWSTAVLVATDKEGADVNTGKNSAEITANGVTKTAVSSGAPGSVWVTVPKDGTVTFQTKTMGTGFQFDPPPGLTAQSGNPPTVSGTPAVGYRYTAPNVGSVPTNTAIHMKFSSATTTGHDLTVLVEDKDNVTAVDHVVTVTAGTAAPLKLHSTTPSGAIQVIFAVPPLAEISGTVTLQKLTAGDRAKGAMIYRKGGAETTVDVPLTATPGKPGEYTFTVPGGMPNVEARLRVTIFKEYKLSLKLGGTVTNPNNAAKLTQSFGGETLELTRAGTAGPIFVPTGTEAKVTVTTAESVQIQTVLAENSDGAAPLTVAPDGTYSYTLERKDTVLTVLLADKTAPANVMATISAVPPGFLIAMADMPTLSILGQTAPHTAQVTAAAGTVVTAHVTVPVGSSATLTASDGTVITGGVIDNKSGTVAIPGTATFSMPVANVHITVTYTLPDPGGEVDPPIEDLTAYTKMVNGDNVVDNAITEIRNVTVFMPNSSPHWAQGREKDTIRVSFTVAQGYSAEVTARTGKPADATGTSVPVIQQGFTDTGYAELQMPNSDVTFTVTYSKNFTPTNKNLTLELVNHERLAENTGKLVVAGGTLDLNGGTATDVNPISAVLTGKAVPDEIITFGGSWKAGHQISKVELVIGAAPNETVTLIDLTRYGLTATARMKMPNDNATLRVTFAPSYKNTLTIFGSIGGDTVSMETAGKPPVTLNNKAIENLQGDETVTTTVTPAVTQKVISVVRTSAKQGAVTLKAAAATPGIYTDTMPHEDAVTAVILGASTSIAHIAKVVYHADSVGQTQPGNGVTIQNTSNPTAAAGTLWVAAEGGNVVELTVNLAAGYQALIVSVTKDSDGTSGIYVNRMNFLTSGTKGSFTMPSDSDATVTIKFIQGYQATLNLVNGAKEPNVTATMTTPLGVITGISAATAGDSVYTSTATSPAPVAPFDTVYGLDDGAKLAATTGANADYWITKTTALTGTQTITTKGQIGTKPGETTIDKENTTVSVILRDDALPILASVLLGGSSDIVGNGVNADGSSAVGISESATAPVVLAVGPQTGRIWTTTASDHYISVKLTVAQGYAAGVAVTVNGVPLSSAADRPFKLDGVPLAMGTATVPIPYDPANPGDPVGKAKTFTFQAPASMTPGSEIVVKVVYETAASIPRPYDPRNAAATPLEAGYILAENHGDYGIVDVSTLYNGTDYFNTDQHSTDPTSKVTFEFALSGAAAGSYVLLTDKEVSITELTNYDYTSTTPSIATKGSKFRLNLLPGAGEALKKIFNNDGTTGALDHQLFVRSKDTAGRMSEYTQVSVPVVYRLSGYVEGFAPNHETVMTLYPLKSEGTPGTDPNYDRNPANYDLTAPIVSMFIDPMEDPGHSLWRQSFDVMSSSLLGKIPAKTTYMLTAERGGNLTYTRVALVLDTADKAHYDATTKTFRLLETIRIKAGDINGDGMVKAQDEFILTSYLQNPGYYTTQKAPGADPATDEGWKRSIYNPNTEAYRCDLNGNGQVDWGDHYDLYMNQNVTTEDYKWKINLAGDMALPFGLDVYVPPVRGAVGPMADLPPEGEIPEEVPGPEGPPTEEQVPETPENPTPEHPLPETPPTEGEVILPETPACPEEIPALPPVPEEGETPNQEPGPNPTPPLGPQGPDKRPNPKPSPPAGKP